MLESVSISMVPKVYLIAAPEKQGSVCTQNFITHHVHETFGVLGTDGVVTACVLSGTAANGIEVVPFMQGDQVARIEVEHSSGPLTVSLGLIHIHCLVIVTRLALLRAARKLFRGEVYIPHSILAEHS